MRRWTGRDRTLSSFEGPKPGQGQKVQADMKRYTQKAGNFSCNKGLFIWRHQNTKSFWIEWGSEIRPSLDYGQKEVGLQMVWISSEIWNWEAQPFEVRTNGCHFVKSNLKSGQKRQDFESSSYQMVGTIAIAWLFEKQTIWNLTSKKSGFKMFQDFEWSDFRSPLSCWLFKDSLCIFEPHSTLNHT